MYKYPDTLSAAVLFEFNKPLKIINISIPPLKKGQVLVKIFYSSICRSQIMEIFSGRNNKKYLPHLLGHEGSGEVVKKAPGTKFKIGDNVILTWIKSDLDESENPQFRFKKKKINSGKVTTFSNYAIVSQDRLIKKPRDISFKNSVLLGCCFMTGPGMVFNETKPKKNAKVILIGLGAVGLGVLLALKQKKAPRGHRSALEPRVCYHEACRFRLTLLRRFGRRASMLLLRQYHQRSLYRRRQ